MITVKNLIKHVHREPLFERVSLKLHKGEKIGLVGPNGSGKSTLLKIIVGELEPDDGAVKIENERVGYLAQQLPIKDGDTIGDFLASEKSKEVLKKVSLNLPLETELKKLSGGQKTRVAFAKLLLSKPTFLLLDEPTNHLDLKGLEWLENLIKNFKGGVLIVSHDRRLLDNTINKILEIDPANQKFNDYEGGYTDYIIEKEKRQGKQQDAYERQQKEKHRLELWLALKRQEASVHADPAKGRKIRAMEKRLQREIYDQEIKNPKDTKMVRPPDFIGDVHSAKLILRVNDVAKSFGNKSVLKDIDLELRGGEHVLLRGENGSGKTTLLKIICGELKPDEGNIRIGDNVSVGYFAQEHESLNLENTVLDEFIETDRLINKEKSPRQILGSFLFQDSDVFKKVSSLSLGERVRLILAKLTNQENHLLLLDEPTNHLDIPSREAIEDALIEYKGAILVVSHDRYFLDRIGINRIATLSDGRLSVSYN